MNPATFDHDPTLEDLLAIVPFGIGESPPLRTGRGLRGQVASLDERSRIVLWGGGIYDWLDPLPVIEAVAELLDDVPELRLVFMGTAHPNPAVPPSSMLGTAKARAKQLGVESAVLFHDAWVAYDDRHNVLLDAEIGVSGHTLHVETELAFRTRILDYIWAGLPVVTTEGDALGDLVAERRLGRVVPPSDPAAVAAALRELLLDESEADAVRQRLAATAPSMRWSAVTTPLVDHCRAPRPAADRDDPDARRLRRRRSPRGRGSVAQVSDLAAGIRSTLEQDGPRALASKVRGRLARRSTA